MEGKKDMKAEILFRAEKLMHYNELLIRQCDSWLTEEEGNENVMRKRGSGDSLGFWRNLENLRIIRILRNLRKLKGVPQT
jgi:hypothetical protein